MYRILYSPVALYRMLYKKMYRILYKQYSATVACCTGSSATSYCSAVQCYSTHQEKSRCLINCTGCCTVELDWLEVALRIPWSWDSYSTTLLFLLFLGEPQGTRVLEEESRLLTKVFAPYENCFHTSGLGTRVTTSRNQSRYFKE